MNADAQGRTFGVNTLALVKNEPKLLNLKEVLMIYNDHQIDVVRRRTQFELNKALDRAHLLEGFRIALDNIDEIIRIIRSSKDDSTASTILMDNFGLSEIQAKAILIENPYHSWLEGLGDPQYLKTVDQIRGFLNEHAVKLKDKEKNKMTEAFLKGCNLEQKFFDSAFHN